MILLDVLHPIAIHRHVRPQRLRDHIQFRCEHDLLDRSNGPAYFSCRAKCRKGCDSKKTISLGLLTISVSEFDGATTLCLRRDMPDQHKVGPRVYIRRTCCCPRSMSCVSDLAIDFDWPNQQVWIRLHDSAQQLHPLAV